MSDNAYHKTNNSSLSFKFNSIVSKLKIYLIHLRKNPFTVVFTILLLICFRLIFYYIFELLGTYNTVTVTIFIISHYWIAVAIRKTVYLIFNKKKDNSYLGLELYNSINYNNFLAFLFIFTTFKFLFFPLFTSLNTGILFLASKDVDIKTSEEVTFDFKNIDDLISKLKTQIEVTNKDNVSKAVADLQSEIKKLDRWESFVLKSLSNEMLEFRKYWDLLSYGAQNKLSKLTQEMYNDGVEVGKVNVEQFVNIHKNLTNKHRNDYNKFFATYNELKPKLNAEAKTELENRIKNTKEDLANKYAIKFKVLDSIKDKSKILQELSKKHGS